MALEVKQDLIIMDIIVAGEHGYAAIEDLKSESALASIPIVIFSGVTHRWGETTASRLDGYLLKLTSLWTRLKNQMFCLALSASISLHKLLDELML